MTKGSSSPHIFSYVIAHDSGFAPNPFGGFLTLATCKPWIRRHARVGDYIVGTGSSRTVGNHKIVFAAKVSDIVSLVDYGRLSEYEVKRPSVSAERWRKHGDNIYYFANGQWKRRDNDHHGIERLEHDVSGENVLICTRFWYYGKDAKDIPAQFHEIIKKGPGYKRIKKESQVNAVIEWLASCPEGRHGVPEMEDCEEQCETKKSHQEGGGS